MPPHTRTANLWLVQRLRRRDVSHFRGFDALFGCDYMGSAEFEWGAVPDSLKRIRSRAVVIEPHDITRGETVREVFFVGHPKKIRAVLDGFGEWLNEDREHSKELTYFRDHFDGTPSEYQQDISAWWSLRDDVMWALDRPTALDLHDAINA